MRCRAPAVLPLLLAGFLLAGGCASGVRRLDGGILEKDETWRGRVEIRGVVLVDRKVHLRIEPGTEVVFLPIDEDADGIGDGELNVLGKLTAQGTPESPIVFRAEEAGKKAWTFLHLSGNRESRLENCVFRDAFTGVQLHYVRAHVRNCLFVDNHEGLRYSTIRGEIRNNDFVGNTVAIRFEGRDSQVTVSRNLFRDNEIGVFPVTRGSREDRFLHNNFFGREYNVKLGFEQHGDLDFSENYWGTVERQQVRAMIFDSLSDPSLGTVEVDPLLTKPVKDAGTERPLNYEGVNDRS
jgi:nitrous oxidase accessory protein NosD